MRLFFCRRALSNRGAATGPILPSRNAAWRETPSFPAVRSASSSDASGGSNPRRATSRLTTASRTRSSSCWRFSLRTGSKASSGKVNRARDFKAAARTSGVPSCAPWSTARWTWSFGADRYPRLSTARAANDDVFVRGRGDQRLDRGRTDSPERERGFLPNPFRLVTEQGDQVGNGGLGVGTNAPQAHDDFRARTFSFRSFSRPRNPSTAGLPMAASARADR